MLYVTENFTFTMRFLLKTSMTNYQPHRFRSVSSRSANRLHGQQTADLTWRFVLRLFQDDRKFRLTIARAAYLVVGVIESHHCITSHSVSGPTFPDMRPSPQASSRIHAIHHLHPSYD